MLGRTVRNRLSTLERRVVSADIQHIQVNHEEKTFIIDNNASYYYKPVPTGLKFHRDTSFVRCMLGPYGSAKTTTLLAEIVLKTCEMPLLNDGSRKARWAIVRNTYGELETTSYVSWIRWFENLGTVHRSKKPVLTMRHQFNDGNGPIDLEVIFLGLDKEADIKKLKSLELTGVYINEASEIPKLILDHFKGRVNNRYPSPTLGSSPYWSGIMMDSNAPKEKHWIPTLFEETRPPGHMLFHQPPGLIKDDEDIWIENPEADNIERLGANYYLNMTYGASEEFVKVYCLGKYGSVLSGKKVYMEYNDDLHATTDLQFTQGWPLYIGFDFGLTPCAIFVQQNPAGQYLLIKELLSERLGIIQFIEHVFEPFINQNLEGIEITAIIGDPAGNKANENDMTSCFDILHEHGYMIEGATSNFLTPRLEAVRFALNRLVDGRPVFLIDKNGAPVVRDGFQGGYQYKRLRVLGQEIYSEKPDKNEFSHPHDALQYVLLYLHTENKRRNDPVNVEAFLQRPLRF